MSTKKYGHIQSYAEQRKQAKLREEEEYDGRYGSVDGTKVKFDIFGKEYGRIGASTVLKTNKGTGYKKVLGDIPEDIPLGATQKELKEWEKSDPTRLRTENGIQPKIITKGGIGKMGTGLNYKIPNGNGGGISAKINAGLAEALNSSGKGIMTGIKKKGIGLGLNVGGAKIKGVGGLNTALNTYQEEETSTNKYLEIDNNGNYVPKKPKPQVMSRISNDDLENRSIEEIWAIKFLDEVSDDDFDKKLTEDHRNKFFELSKYITNRNTNGIREIFEWFANEFKDYKRILPQSGTIVFAVIGKYSEAVTISTDVQSTLPQEVITKIQSLKLLVDGTFKNGIVTNMIPDSADRILNRIFDSYKDSSLEEIGKLVAQAEVIVAKVGDYKFSGVGDLLRGIRESVEANTSRGGRGRSRIGGMRIMDGGTTGTKWDKYTVGNTRGGISTKRVSVDFGIDESDVGLMGRARKLGIGTGGTIANRYNNDDYGYGGNSRYDVPKSRLNRNSLSVGRVNGAEFAVKNTVSSEPSDPFNQPVYGVNTIR